MATVGFKGLSNVVL